FFRNLGVQLGALEDSQIAVLRGGGAVRIALGHGSEIFTIIQNAIAQAFRLFFQRVNVGFGLAFRGNENFTKNHSLGADKLGLVVVVIFDDVFVTHDNFGADF